MAQAVSTRGPVSGTATAGKKRRKLFLLDLYSTAVGKKYAMALSGIALMGFVLVHMIGNLKVYLGAEEINHYGEFLRELLVPLAPRTVVLWVMRLGLIGAVALHVHAAYSLTQLNRHARSVKYQSARDYQVANFASRTMRWTGIIVLLFLFFHLADLTWGWFNPDFVRGDVYYNLDASLSRLDQYKSNSVFARNQLGLEESALTSVIDNLQRVRELTPEDHRRLVDQAMNEMKQAHEQR